MLATYQPWLIHVDIGCTNSGKRDLPWYRTWQKLYLPRMHLFPTSGNHEVNALIHLSDMSSISRGLRKINIILKQPMPHAGYWKTAHYGLTNSKGLNSPSAEEWLCRSSLMFQRCISNLLALGAFSLFRLSQSPSQRDQQDAKELANGVLMSHEKTLIYLDVKELQVNQIICKCHFWCWDQNLLCQAPPLLGRCVSSSTPCIAAAEVHDVNLSNESKSRYIQIGQQIETAKIDFISNQK